MALLVKNSNTMRTAGVAGVGQAILSQYIHVARPATALPATTTDILFRVYGGRVVMYLLVGQVTTIIQAQACNIRVSGKALDVTSTAVGTAVDVCANVDGNAKEVGSMYVPLGSGAAAIWSNAGAALGTLGRNPVILPQGEVYITTSATNTGAMKWDIWYQPLDEGAYVVANGVAAAI